MYGFTELVSLVLNSVCTMDIFMLLFSITVPPKVTKISMKLALLVSHVAETRLS